MKTVNFSKVGFSVGGGIALILFMLVWLLPVSYFSGVLGAKLGKYILADLQGIFAGIFMVIGVITSGFIFLAIGGFTGWVGGTVIDKVKKSESSADESIRERGKTSSSSGLSGDHADGHTY